MNSRPKELTFPREWEFRLFVSGEKAESVRAELLKLDASERAGLTIRSGESSSGGKFVTIRVFCTVPSLERARELAARMGGFPGVKFMV